MTELAERLDKQAALFIDSDLLEEFTSSANNRAQWASLDGLLRAITRSLLDATRTLRHEHMEEYAQVLASTSRRIQFELGEKLDDLDANYMLGRIESLLDVCDMAIDRSISEEVIGRVRDRVHAFDILAYLERCGESSPKVLSRCLDIRSNHLSNVLRWMESDDLIRRTSVGRGVSISLGPKGEAVHSAVLAIKLTAATDTKTDQTEWPAVMLGAETQYKTSEVSPDGKTHLPSVTWATAA